MPMKTTSVATAAVEIMASETEFNPVDQASTRQALPYGSSPDTATP